MPDWSRFNPVKRATKPAIRIEATAGSRSNLLAIESDGWSAGLTLFFFSTMVNAVRKNGWTESQQSRGPSLLFRHSVEEPLDGYFLSSHNMIISGHPDPRLRGGSG